jgi:hypothetical protein
VAVARLITFESQKSSLFFFGFRVVLNSIVIFCDVSLCGGVLWGIS